MFTFLPFDWLLSNADILGLLPLSFPLVFVVFGQDITSVKNIQKTKRQLFPKVLTQNNL